MKYIKFPHCIVVNKKVIKSYRIFAIENLEIRIVKDVTTENEAIKNLVKRLNDGKVELIHLDDIIEDFYCE